MQSWGSITSKFKFRDKSMVDELNCRLSIISGEDWNSARLAGTSPQHVLLPISINLLLQKSMFDNDRRLAK